MILNIITQTHNRRNIFLKNFDFNFKTILNYIKDLNIKINWIINVDDKSIKKEDIKIYSNKSNKIKIFFYEKTNFFPKRYFELMLIQPSDMIWCLEDDDLIYKNFFKDINKNYNHIFYYESDFDKINQDINDNLKEKKINFNTWQLSQMVLRYKDIKKFFYLKKKTDFFKNKNFINYDEDILEFLLKKTKYLIHNKKIFKQKIHGDNMSIESLLKWK